MKINSYENSRSRQTPKSLSIFSEMLECWLRAIENSLDRFNFHEMDFIGRVRMQEMIQNLRDEYTLSPLDLVRKRNQILAIERRIVNGLFLSFTKINF